MANLLTMDELRKQLKVSRQQIYNWRDEGMPFLRLNRMVRYDMDVVMEWLLAKGQEKQAK